MEDELKKQAKELSEFGEKVAKALEGIEWRIEYISDKVESLVREYHTHLCFQTIVLRELLKNATVQMSPEDREYFLNDCILGNFNKVIEEAGIELSDETGKAIKENFNSFKEHWNKFLLITAIEFTHEGKEPKA